MRAVTSSGSSPKAAAVTRIGASSVVISCPPVSMHSCGSPVNTTLKYAYAVSV